MKSGQVIPVPDTELPPLGEIVAVKVGWLNLAGLKSQQQIAVVIHLNRRIVAQADLINCPSATIGVPQVGWGTLRVTRPPGLCVWNCQEGPLGRSLQVRLPGRTLSVIPLRAGGQPHRLRSAKSFRS